MNLQRHPRPHKGARKAKLDGERLEATPYRITFQEALQGILPAIRAKVHDTEALINVWDKVTEVLLENAKIILGENLKRNRDWFDEHDQEIESNSLRS